MMMRILVLILLLAEVDARASTYSATPSNYANVMANLQSGDAVRWQDPGLVVPAYYDRKARFFDPPVEIDFGTATVRPQRFTNLTGAVFRGGVFSNEFRTAETGLSLSGTAVNIKLLGMTFRGGRNGIAISWGKNIYLENIQCDSMGNDCVDAPNIVNLEVRGLNCFGDKMIPFAHPDCFQTWAQFGEQHPANLSFDNVHCEGVIQCVSDFVHTSAKDRPLGPDPQPENVKITNLVDRGHSGWAISFGGCVGICIAENVTVIPDEAATFKPHVAMPTVRNIDQQPVGSLATVVPWSPSAERYPRTMTVSTAGVHARAK